MGNKTETIQKIITPMRKNRFLNHDYLNPSMIEMNPTEDGIRCKENFFIVDWQMQHHEPDYFPKQKHIEE